MTRWVLLLAVALSMGCDWQWERSCEGILTLEIECETICSTDLTVVACWEPFNDSTQCGTCFCDDPLDPLCPI